MDAFDVLNDLDALRLGDTRLESRARSIVRRLSSSPSSPLPELFPDESELTAVYRMAKRPHVSELGLLRPHIEATVERSAAIGDVLVLHDTTEFAFAAGGGRPTREHLSLISARRQGFYAHVSLAVSDGPLSVPLGVLHLQPYVHRSQVGAASAAWWEARGGLFDNEHERWPEACLLTDDLVSDRGIRPIHVADREGDSNAMLLGLSRAGLRFVIRCSSPHRAVSSAHGNAPDVAAVAAQAVVSGETVRTVWVRRQRAGQRASVDATPRKAELRVRHCPVTLRTDKGKTVSLWLVDVIELQPPAGEEPVRWLLYTTEPTENEADAWLCVDRYRRRWMIEEWFKALKTGVDYEARQLESAHSLLNFLAFAVYVATQMLVLRALHRAAPEMHADEMFEPDAIAVVAKFVPKARLGPQSTLGALLSAIAAWGGHQKSNGPPGWLTLFRGYAKLLQSLETLRAFGVYLPQSAVDGPVEE
jgi:hypothetical protein